MTVGIPEPAVLPDGTVGMVAPSAVFGPAASALLSDGVRAAASAAQLTVPAAGADPAMAVQGLDTLIASASNLTNMAATALAAQTAAAVNARALPRWPRSPRWTACW